MALTVSPDLTRLSAADSTTGWNSAKLAGSGGTPSPVLDAEIFLQGSAAISLVTNKTKMRLTYSTSAISFTGGEAGKLVYIWAMVTTIGSTKTTALGGVQIALGDGSNWAYFHVNGSDLSKGGWQRYVIDPNQTPTSGSVNLGAITDFGIVVDMGAQPSKTANLFVDAIDVGRGLTVTGTDVDMWESILAADSLTTNKYGIIRKDNGVYFVLGDVTLGDAATTTVLEAYGNVVVWENPLYYQGGFTSCLGAGVFEFTTNVGGSSLSFKLGDKIGAGDTMGGSNGCSIISAGQNLKVDLSDAAASFIGVYGSIIQAANGGVFLANNPAHEVAGTTFTKCGQIDSQSTLLRACTISGYTDVADGALLWTSLTDIKNSQFLSNANGTTNSYAIKFDATVASSVTFSGLAFSGNDSDVFNDSAKAVTINITGGGSAITYVDGSGASTSVVNSVSVTFSNIVNSTEVRVYATVGREELAGIEDTTTGAFVFTYQAGTSVDLVFFHVQYDPIYLDAFVMPAQDATIPVQQIFSRSYLNP